MNTPIFSIDWKSQSMKALKTLLLSIVYAVAAAIVGFIVNSVPGLLQDTIQNPAVLTLALGLVKVIGDTLTHLLTDEQGKFLGHSF